MKVYVILKIADFDCNIDGKQYKPVRAMIAEIKDGKRVAIKLIKCDKDFAPPLEKKINIFFDENGKAVSYQSIG